MARTNIDRRELRERTVPMVAEVTADYRSPWTATEAVTSKLDSRTADKSMWRATEPFLVGWCADREAQLRGDGVLLFESQRSGEYTASTNSSRRAGGVDDRVMDEDDRGPAAGKPKPLFSPRS